MFAKMADFIHSHSKAIVVVWLAVLICSLPLGIHAGDVLEYDMTNMSGADSESTTGAQIMSDYFLSIGMDEIAVAPYSSEEEFKALVNESDPSDDTTFLGRFTSIMGEKFDNMVVQYGGTYQKDPASSEGIVLIAISSTDGSDITHKTGEIRDAVADAKGGMASYSDVTIYVTGSSAINYDTEVSSGEDISKVDPFSILLIFVLLGLFFYAVVTALVPPMVVGMAYGITLTLIYAIGQFLGIFYITQVLLLVVMLGAGCDYAIFIITRYRDERKKGQSHEAALKEAVMWGGESVATSGISVMIGFAALALCSFSLVQTMGIILALGILVALLAALTFIPALIDVIGDKVFWPSSIDSYKATDEKVVSGGKKGFHGHLVSFGKRYFGWLSRFTQLTKLSGTDAWTFEPTKVLGVTADQMPIALSNAMDYYLNVYTGILSTDGKYVNMTIITTEKPMSDNTMVFITDLRSDLRDGDDAYMNVYSNVFVDSWVSGSSAMMEDIGNTVEEQFSFIRIVVIVLLILLLFVILGCYVTPIRSLITIVMSVVWTVALTHLVFDVVLDTPVLFLVPIVLFVVLLGLGMDYEIFLTTKIRENRIKGMDNDTAIDEAVKQAGGVISLCALLMGGTFLTLLLANSSMLQEFGFALGVGILIDGLFMVGFVSPSLMHILGEWSWKGPRFLQRGHSTVPEPKDEQ